MTIIMLVEQVCKGIEAGTIPASPYVPLVMESEVPVWFGRRLKHGLRPTVGKWAGFAYETAEYMDPDEYDTYYISAAGVFAVAAYHPSRIVLTPLSVVQVLRREDMWRQSLQAMLDPTSRPQGLYLNPV